ncbi:MAG: trypsin-like peptidase domain-containing protein [Bacteroidales bacterium]|nr:trypsin-like peptidase domain-containing protein [Bacteroidales bacterium]
MKSFLIIAVTSLFCLQLRSQVSVGGEPHGKSLNGFKSASDVPVKNLKKLRVEKLLKADQKSGKLPLRYALVKNVDIDIKKAGAKTKTLSGNIWLYKIISPNAKSLSLVFNKYKLPQGAKLFIYNTDFNPVYGAFTNINNKEHGAFAIADYPGNSLIIEYYEPDNAGFQGQIVLGQIGQAYRSLDEPEVFKAADDDGLIDINCSEGDKVQLQKHAVAKMTFGGYLCTGALINNTRNNGTPYFLTANHCISDTETPKTLITYFNYEYLDCGASQFSSAKSLSGARYITGFSDTDYTLLLLDEVPAPAYQAFYAGWNVESDSLVRSGTGIHHPEGARKKVSVSASDIVTVSRTIDWNGSESPENTHWLVFFDKGETRGGSSGSPLFDENNRIIGQLHGGDENNFYNLYGKLSRSWDKPAGPKRLKNYLDPDNTGVTTLDGYIPAGNFVDAFPYVEYNNFCAGQPIELKDGSLFGAESWQWSISPGSFYYVEGTGTDSQNPKVVFTAPGSYSLSLSVAGNGRTDSQTRSNYINTNGLDISYVSNNSDRFCDTDTIEAEYRLAGADSFAYSFANSAGFLQFDSTKSSPSGFVLKQIGDIQIDTSVLIKVIIEGYYGECSAVDTAIVYIDHVAPNDSIKNAISLNYGDNGWFANFCASPEDNEPHPKIGDCSTPGQWCDCEIGGPYIDNSIWFTFIGPETGAVGIDCPGFDNQVAVYEASSASDIISGNPLLYKIIAASDDYYGEDMDYAARIVNVKVTPDRQYWLQVDGSACGASGNFKVILTKETPSDINTQIAANNFTVFPNPVSEKFTISGTGAAKLWLKLYTADGRLAHEYIINNPLVGNEHTLEIPASLLGGLYILEITDGEHTSTVKLSVQK